MHFTSFKNSTPSTLLDNFEVVYDMETLLYESYPELYNPLSDLMQHDLSAYENVRDNILTEFRHYFYALRNSNEWVRDTFSKIQELKIFMTSLRAKLASKDLDSGFLTDKQEFLNSMVNRGYITAVIYDRHRMTRTLQDFEKTLCSYTKQVLKVLN